MDIIGIVILIVAVLGLIAAVIYLFMRSDFPHYECKTVDQYKGTKIRIWAEDEYLLNMYQSYVVAFAVNCVEAAWRELKLPNQDKVSKVLEEVGFLITTRQGFQKWSGQPYGKVASVQSWTKDKIYSKNIPLIVVHEGTLDRLKTSTGTSLPKGQPVIHETIHAVLQMVTKSADFYHENDDIWAKIDDDKSQLEEVAENLFAKGKGVVW